MVELAVTHTSIVYVELTLLGVKFGTKASGQGSRLIALMSRVQTWAGAC